MPRTYAHTADVLWHVRCGTSQHMSLQTTGKEEVWFSFNVHDCSALSHVAPHANLLHMRIMRCLRCLVCAFWSGPVECQRRVALQEGPRQCAWRLPERS